jgi:hypothetical protein
MKASDTAGYVVVAIHLLARHLTWRRSNRAAKDVIGGSSLFALRALSEPPHNCAAVAKGAAMAGRGPQSFKKRQKEQQRKEKQQEKAAKRLQRKIDKENGVIVADDDDTLDDLDLDLDSAEGESEEGVKVAEVAEKAVERV